MLPLFDASILLLITVELIPVPLLCTSKFIFVKLFYLNVTTAFLSDESTLVGVISRDINCIWSRFFLKLISCTSLFRENRAYSFKLWFGLMDKCNVLSYLLPKDGWNLEFFFSGKRIFGSNLKKTKNTQFLCKMSLVNLCQNVLQLLLLLLLLFVKYLSDI